MRPPATLSECSCGTRKTFRCHISYLCTEIAVMPSVDVLKPVFRQRRKILSSPNLKLCQFSLQPSKFQKAGGYFTEVTAHEFATIPAAGAMVNICQWFSMTCSRVPRTSAISQFFRPHATRSTVLNCIGFRRSASVRLSTVSCGWDDTTDIVFTSVPQVSTEPLAPVVVPKQS